MILYLQLEEVECSDLGSLFHCTIQDRKVQPQLFRSESHFATTSTCNDEIARVEDAIMATERIESKDTFAHFLHASVVDREILVIDWPGWQTSTKFNGSEIQGVN